MGSSFNVCDYYELMDNVNLFIFCYQGSNHAYGNGSRYSYGDGSCYEYGRKLRLDPYTQFMYIDNRSHVLCWADETLKVRDTKLRSYWSRFEDADNFYKRGFRITTGGLNLW